MKSNYKPTDTTLYHFSDLIEEVTEYNTDLQYGLSDIVGVTIDKGLIPTIANLNQTALDKFYVVKPKTFVYNPRTHGVKLGMGFNQTTETYITSWNNVAFRVKESALGVLNPLYLWLYFNRAEWDRETNYRAWGSSTIVFAWNTFLSMSLRLPPKSYQDKLCEQYSIIEDRIALKQRINDNLEETINTVFEKFYIEKCQHEVSLSDLCNLSSSKRVFADQYVEQGTPFYRGGEITLKRKGEPITTPLYISDEHYEMLKKKYGVPVEGDILITAVGTIGNSYLVEDEDFYFKDGNIIWLRNFVRPEYGYFMYDYMQSSWFHEQLDGICIGSTQTALTIAALSQIKMKIPDNSVLREYARKSLVVRHRIQYNQKELLKLHEILQFLLSSLTSC